MAITAERRKLFERKNLVASYAAAVAAGGVAALIHWGLARQIGTHYLPWAAYYIAVMLIEWWVGWRHAIVTAVVGLFFGLLVDLLPKGDPQTTG